VLGERISASDVKCTGKSYQTERASPGIRVVKSEESPSNSPASIDKPLFLRKKLGCLLLARQTLNPAPASIFSRFPTGYPQIYPQVLWMLPSRVAGRSPVPIRTRRTACGGDADGACEAGGAGLRNTGCEAPGDAQRIAPRRSRVMAWSAPGSASAAATGAPTRSRMQGAMALGMKRMMPR
jgi:hypothetical protein